MSISCRHDGTKHPEAANYCMSCGQPLRPPTLPAIRAQLRCADRDFTLPLNIVVRWRATGVSRRAETAAANQEQLIPDSAQLTLQVHSRERGVLERPVNHPFGTEDALTRMDTFLETSVQPVAWLDLRIDRTVDAPLDWTVSIRCGLERFAVFEAAAAMHMIMRRALWALGCALVAFIVFRAAGGVDAPIWVLATCLAYLAVTGVAGGLDQRYSQGPSGPPPPETYS